MSLGFYKFNLFDLIRLKYNNFFKYLNSRLDYLLHTSITKYEIVTNFLGMDETLTGSYKWVYMDIIWLILSYNCIAARWVNFEDRDQAMHIENEQVQFLFKTKKCTKWVKFFLTWYL